MSAPGLAVVHLVCDLLIGLAYIAVAATLIDFTRRRTELPFRLVFMAFVIFLVAGAATHLMDALAPGHAGGWMAGGVKIVTAIASVATALLLPPLIPKALAWPSPRALAAANTELAAEVAERRRAEAKFRGLLESAPDGIVIVDAQGRIEIVNGRAETLFGYTRAELIGESLERLLPGHPPGARAPGDVAGRHRDGSYFPAEVHTSAVATDDGTLHTTVVRDVTERTERIRAEAAATQLEQARQRSAFLAEASRVLGGSLDYEATLKSVARVALPELADYCLVDVVAEDGSLRRLASAHADPAQEALLREAGPPGPDGQRGFEGVVAQREPMLVAEVMEDPFGLPPAFRPRSLILVPLLARGRTLGVIAFVLTRAGRRYTVADLETAEDLAHRAALAADNARLYRDAQDANRAKDEFLAVLSHELRTPLTPVLGWVRMLRADTLEPAATARALETIERNTRLQLKLIDDLLDVSRMITGKLHLDPGVVNLNVAVHTAAAVAAPAAAAKGIEVRTHVAPDAGAINADTARLQQILSHLLSNAIKFTPDGGHVDLRVERFPQSVRLTVADTGHGINPQVLPHIFERFRQADSTITRQFGGLGLGLAIVRHLVELHGGTVVAESRGPEEGAVFHVTLPTVPVAATPAPVPVRAIGAAASARVLAGVHVLLVDDEPDAREMVTIMLTRYGAEVTAVGSVDEALALAPPRPPAVIVSDLAMPARDGYDFIRELHRRGNPVLALALTAHARPEDRQRVIAAGFRGHVAKPVDPEELVAAIRRVLEQAGEQRRA